jgi:hypothetical protein
MAVYGAKVVVNFVGRYACNRTELGLPERRHRQAEPSGAITGTMQNNDDKEDCSRQLARALDQLAVTVIRTPTMDATEIVSRCDEIELAFVERLAGDVTLQLETRRRVAERKLSLLTDRNSPYAVVASTMNELYTLGFADLERKATFQLAFASYTVRQQLPEKARELIEPLREELRSKLQFDKNPVYGDLLHRVEAFLRQL